MLVHLATHYRDLARWSADADARSTAQVMVDLLTPVAKAWPTDIAFAATSAGLQVLGGVGYVEESGMAQRLRDGRIPLIYEGTNGIQAIDLVTRKLPHDGGRAIRQLIETIARSADGPDHADDPLTVSRGCVADAVGVLRDVTDRLLAAVDDAPDDALAGASAYLELFGLTLGGWLMVRRAEHLGADDARGGPAALECEFFATEHTARAVGLVRPALAGASRLAIGDQPDGARLV